MTGKPVHPSHQSTADVVVIGDGVIGLATALAIARTGGSCRVIGRPIPGAASLASAGLLAPSLGAADPDFRSFMRASRERYPDWVHWLAERTGIEVTLSRAGIIELGAGPIATSSDDVLELDAESLHSLEHSIAPTRSARLYSDDGFVDNVRLMAALREATRCEWSVDLAEGRVAAIEPGMNSCRVITEDGRQQVTKAVVLAAGTWSALIAGVPRPVPVEPVRGQMVRLRGCPLSRAVSSPDAYLVPRGDSTLVGSTLERVGFDSATTSTAVEHLRHAAAAIVPTLAHADVLEAWAGLRPVSLDGRPLIGRDPDLPSVIYACGHGKNGILLAPLTAECLAAIAANEAPPFDLALFDIQRFA